MDHLGLRIFIRYKRLCLGDGQTEASLKDMGMTGLAAAWVMARRRPI